MLLDRIDARHKFRTKIMDERNKFRAEQHCKNRYDRDDISLLNGESIDDYIKHRIETDKVLIGILKDIQAEIAEIADNQLVEKLKS